MLDRIASADTEPNCSGHRTLDLHAVFVRFLFPARISLNSVQDPLQSNGKLLRTIWTLMIANNVKQADKCRLLHMFEDPLRWDQ